MNGQENIIAIRNRSITEANKAFDDFMSKTEKCFNDRSKANPKLYQRIRVSNLMFYKKKDKDIYEKMLKHFLEETKKEKMFGNWNDYGRLLEY